MGGVLNKELVDKYSIMERNMSKRKDQPCTENAESSHDSDKFEIVDRKSES